jgi:rod shape-determining protein MreC
VTAYRSTSRTRFTLVLLILTSVTLLTLDIRGFAPLESARSAALDVLAPVKDAASSAFEPVGDAWNGALGYDELEAENEKLQERIAELEGELALGADAKTTLQRLYDELGIDYVGDIDTVVATVAVGPVGNVDNTIEIDKGSDAGLAVDMPVVSSTGLVGTVSQVSKTRAVVTLVTDVGFNVGVRLSETGDVGVARGQGRGRPMVIYEGIETDLEVQDGELVTTSGQDRALFPASVPIGTVAGAATPAGDLDQDLFVETLADLDSLTFVNVMLWVPEP